MRDPVRLLNDELPELERALLDAGATEQPSAQARRQLAAVLGLGGAQKMSAGAAAGQASQAPAAVGLLGKAGATWWVLAGAGAILASSVWWRPASPAAPAPATAATHEEAAVTPPAPSPPESAASAVAGMDVSELVPPPGHAASASIEGEITHIASARALLRDAQPGAALDALAQYAAAHPRGVLQQEAERLRIDALFGEGANRAAMARARRFLRAHSHSPHAAHVRALLKEHARDE